MTTYSWPAKGGGGVLIFDTFADFPAPGTYPEGTLAVAADTGIVYEDRGTSWVEVAGPIGTQGITQLTGDVLAGPGVGSQKATLINTPDIYYIDFTNGSDSGTGSLVEPFLTLQHAYGVCSTVNPVIFVLSGGADANDPSTITALPNVSLFAPQLVTIPQNFSMYTTTPPSTYTYFVEHTNIVFAGSFSWSINSSINTNVIFNNVIGAGTFSVVQTGSGTMNIFMYNCIFEQSTEWGSNNGSIYLFNTVFTSAAPDSNTFYDSTGAIIMLGGGGYGPMVYTGGVIILGFGFSNPYLLGATVTFVTTDTGTPNVIATDDFFTPNMPITGSYNFVPNSNSQYTSYTPANPGNWASPPSYVAQALDDLAAAGVPLTFSDSLVNTVGVSGGVVTLVNDNPTPGNSNYYGTNASGVLGYYAIANPTALSFSDSLVDTAGVVTLVGDSPTPGDNQYYGTNGSGVLGYYLRDAGTLSGITLASNVVASSLRTVGILTGGTWNATTIAVPYGGTGDTSFTAYSVLCGGTSSTGSLQNVSGVGTSGQLLTSNGASALPSWQTYTPTFSGLTTDGVIYASSSSAIASTSAGSHYQPLVANSSGAPSFQALALNQSAAVTGTLAIANGGTAVTALPTSATSSAFAAWDSNSNLSANSLISGFNTTATAAGTTTLTVSSAFLQVFTGTSTQTVKLPVASTLSNGQGFLIQNLSTGAVTVETSGTNTLQVLGSNTQIQVYCTNPSGGTGTASWTWAYQALMSNNTALAPTQQLLTSTSSATYTTPSNPTPKYIKGTMVGGGGGGGGSANVGGIAGSGGGGAGGLCIFYINNPASSYSYQCGSGGAGGTAGGNTGTAGGTTKFNGTTYEATGGSGGTGSSGISSVGYGGAAGVGSGGLINSYGNGGAGGAPGVSGATQGTAGIGGGSFFGGGAPVSGGGGTGGNQYGAGGSGTANTNAAGGSGYQGVILIEEFY